MDELLKPIKTSTLIKPDQDPLLTISSEHRTSQKSASRTALGIAQHPPQSLTPSTFDKITTKDEALQALRSKPSHSQLSAILSFLTRPNVDGYLDIHSPTAASSQLVKVLVDITIPDYWKVLIAPDYAPQYKSEREALVHSLRSVTGLAGIVARLVALVRFSGTASESEEGKKEIGEQLGNLLEVLEQILRRKSFLWSIWCEMKLLEPVDIKRGLLWKELVAFIAGGRVFSATAAAENYLSGDVTTGTNSRWIGDGGKYCMWLGKGIGIAAEKLEQTDEDGWKGLRAMLWRAYGLAWWDEVVENVTFTLIEPLERWDVLGKLLTPSHLHEKQRYLTSLLRLLGKKYLDPVPSREANWWTVDEVKVSGIAAILKSILQLDEGFKKILLELFQSNAKVGTPIGIRRAIIATLQDDEKSLNYVFEKSLLDFGDKLWIKHTPMQAQEVGTQFLLLTAGALNRQYPQTVHASVHSTSYLNAISNRLASQSPRARFLGMLVGEALSGLADKDGSKLGFKIDEMESEEALWWKGLVHVRDKVGKAANLYGPKAKPKKQPVPTSAPSKPVVRQSRIVEIIELDDDDNGDGSDCMDATKAEQPSESDEEDSDDEFQPYEKPDSDAEDSDDDPTLVNRNKDPAPVYVRDLLRLLRSNDSYDKQHLALTHAPLLIRRKATFGTEVSDHLYDLATSLTAIQDKFDMENFQELRIQALIALIVAQPVKMGQWTAQAFFEGDYSLAQRATMLTAIGMGARELAGYKDDDLPLSEASGKGRSPESLFPSKMLPAKMHEIYSHSSATPPPKKPLKAVGAATATAAAAATKRLTFIISSLERRMIQPMVQEAASNTPGASALNIFKTRTFSTRMEVEKRTKKPASSKLSKIVAEAFFFPLTARWWVKLKESSSGASGSGRSPPQFEPFLLTTFLKTLALVLHAAGPSTVTLPQMTREFWDLLLSLRHHYHNPNYAGITTSPLIARRGLESTETDEPTVLEGILFSLLTILELNVESGDSGRSRLVDEHGKELVETHEWVGLVFENAPSGGGGIGIGGGGDEEERVRYLSAAVLMKTKDVMEGYERRLAGQMMSLE